VRYVAEITWDRNINIPPLSHFCLLFGPKFRHGIFRNIFKMANKIEAVHKERLWCWPPGYLNRQNQSHSKSQHRINRNNRIQNNGAQNSTMSGFALFGKETHNAPSWAGFMPSDRNAENDPSFVRLGLGWNISVETNFISGTVSTQTLWSHGINRLGSAFIIHWRLVAGFVCRHLRPVGWSKLAKSLNVTFLFEEQASQNGIYREYRGGTLFQLSWLSCG
jgi:hypothetical protein